MPDLSRKQLTTAICFALAVGTFALYCPILRDDFINFDDNAYVTGNAHVKAGLTKSGIIWAFKNGYAANWHPLTWISHMMDCQLFGLNPAGHFLINMLFHTANTVLLFILLNYMTGAIWRSAFVAALFAWHPLHVESVAWASERKDVLSAFFWMLTLLAYAGYVRAKSSRHQLSSAINYLLALALFACGLMSKPMVVTLPFVLLLLDFWPLGRFSLPAIPKLLMEKIPFFALSIIGCVITYLVQKNGGAVTGDSLSFRVMNVLGSYLGYISKLFWPVDLAIFYPFPAHGMLGMAIAGMLLLGFCSVTFILLSGRWPYLFTGWFWFLGTLVPVIGIVEVGSASMADRYSYLPSIGLFILVTWGMADFFESKREKTIPAALATAVLIACVALTSIQIRYWRNNLTLFSHALAVTTDNYVACACLGQALDVLGHEDEALKYCQLAVKIDPNYPAGQFFLGEVLWKKGQVAQALNHLQLAVQTAPDNSDFQYNLGKFLLEHGQPDQAILRFNAALKADPDFAEAHNALGKTFLKEGKMQPAADQLSQAVALAPDNAQFHYDLGTVLLALAKPDKAIDEFSEAIRLQPDFVLAHENLAAALAEEGKLPQAIEHFSKVAQLQPNNPEAYFNLGFAYLNNRQPAPAAAQFTEELRLTPNETKAHYRLAQALQEQNQLPQAVFEYRQALRLTPSFPNARTALNEILAAHPQLR